MAVATVDGSVLFHAKFPNDRSLQNSPPVVASKGGRFALMQERELRTNVALDVGQWWADDEIIVYDISERRAIFALKVKGVSPWPSSTEHTNEFALSPDGDRLAVVSDGELRIYKLPLAQPAN